jgi:hypothetical protein
MKKQDIEYKVLNILERLEKGHPIEDDEVELKAEWPKDHFRAARRIAAHANASRGEPILWLIGIDEKKGPVGADFEELSIWYAKLRSNFDQLLVPNLVSLAIPYEGMTIVALLFETERSPYVIKIPDGAGLVSYEVPWREANSTRSARRSDLIKLLYPIQKKPRLEIIDGKIELQKALTGQNGSSSYQWSLNLKLYIVTFSSETIVIPLHKCEVVFRPAGRPDERKFEEIRLAPPTSFNTRGMERKSQSLTVRATDYEVLIDTAGMMQLTGESFVENRPSGMLYEEITVKGRLKSHHIEDFITFSVDFALVGSPKPDNSDRILGTWKLVEPEDF